MKIISIQLRNFGLYENFETEFSCGLNGIFGRNGSGKSTILTAIQYALSGTVTDPLETYIRSNADPGEPSFVKLTIQSDVTGKVVTITRSIRPRSAMLECEGRKIGRVKEIETYLGSTFGLDLQVLKNVQIVPQEDIVALFSLNSSENKQLLSRIFNLYALHKRYDDLRAMLNSIRSVTDVRQQVVVLQDLIGQKETAIKAYSAIPALADLVTKKQEMSETLDAASELISTYERSLFIVSNIKRATADLTTKQAAYAQAIRTRDSLRSVEAIQQDLEQVTAARKAEAEELAKSQSVLGFATTELLPGLEEIKQSFLALSTLDLSLAPSLQSLRDELTMLTSWRDRVTPAAENGVCPTCHKPYPEAKAELSRVTTELQSVSLRYNQAKLSSEALSDTSKHIGGIIQRLRNSLEYRNIPEALSESIIRLSNSECSTDSLQSEGCVEHAIAAVKDMISTLTDQIDSIKLSSSKHNDEQRAFKQELQGVNVAIQSALAAGSAETTAEEYLQRWVSAANPIIDYTPEEYNAAKVIRDRCCVQREELNIAFQQDAIREQLRKDIADLKGRVESMNSRIQRNDELTLYKADLQEVLNILHPNNLPRAAVIGMSRAVMTNINSYLQLFDAPFTAAMDDDAEIFATFPSGVSQPARRLSGGQKVILALAWRLALHSTFATDEACGFLTLDEPTTFLDSENIENLHSVIQQIRDLANKSNIQIIVITHEQSLSPLFDTVISC